MKTHIIRQEDYTSSITGKHLLRVSWNDTLVTSQVKRMLCRIRHAGSKYHLQANYHKLLDNTQIGSSNCKAQRHVVV